MKILLTGGGTAGHITPILALAEELKHIRPDVRTIYIGERNGKFASLTNSSQVIDEHYSISSGKFRRYHGESWSTRLFDVKTIAKNARDVFRVSFGLFQSLRLLRRVNPDVVFLKGGFVGVPVGLAAALYKIPIVTHDSDAIPGLANRIVSRWTSVHATALPAEYYRYNKQKISSVGVLVEKSYVPVDTKLQAQYKQSLKLPSNDQLLLITGGSSGAERINNAVMSIVDELLSSRPKLQVILQVGYGKRSSFENYKNSRLRIVEFMKGMYVYAGAADLIVTRAGANALAEFGVQGKACVVVPNPDLTGGHQTKNAQLLKEQGSVEVVEEDKLYDKTTGLLSIVEDLLQNDKKREQLAQNIQKNTTRNAAQKLAGILIDVAQKGTKIGG